MESRLFSEKQINGARQNEMDWARGFAVLFMVLIHVKSEMLDFQSPALFSRVMEFCGGPLAAPVFMALLGVGIIYSKSRTPKKLAIRGLWLFAGHYILNLLYSGVPRLIMLARTGDEYYSASFWKYTFSIDIFAFAGLTFLFFALVEKLKLKNVHLILVALIFSLINYIGASSVDYSALGAFLGLFFHVNYFSFFPFFSWIWYPIMGYIFGSFLIRCTDKKTFYSYAFVFSALIVVLLSFGANKYGFDIWSMHSGVKSDYFFQDFISHILLSGIFFMWLGVLYGVSQLKIFRLFGNVVSRWSRNVTVIYVVQWLIIGWVSILGLLDLPVTALASTITGIVILILSDAAAWLYLKTKKAISSDNGGVKAG